VTVSALMQASESEFSIGHCCDEKRNVIFSVGHNDISHATRLSSVWPISIQYATDQTLKVRRK